jgi:hypothetical protein
VAALGAVTGLLLNAMMFAWHVPGLSVQGQLAHELGYRTIVICSGQGFRTIVVDSNGQRVPHPQAPGPRHEQASKSCPVCIALGGLVLALPIESPHGLVMMGFQVVAYAEAVDRVRDRRPLVRNGHDPPLAS